jgi:tetratricopeptide (TPR) repeat protein
MRTMIRRGLFARAGLVPIFAGFALLALSGAVSALLGQDAKALFEQGIAAQHIHDYDTAIASYSEVIQLDPKLAPAYYNRSAAYEAKGDHAKAIADLSRTLELNPTVIPAYNNLAWLLATCSQANLRDGKRAVDLATKACDLTQWKSRAELDTLAAACAEAGDFDSAIKWQNEMLSAPGISAQATMNGQGRLALYQAHQAFHESK